jgi:hypothetical protein
MSKFKPANVLELKGLISGNDKEELEKRFRPIGEEQPDGSFKRVDSIYVAMCQDPSLYVELLKFAAQGGHTRSLVFLLSEERQLPVPIEEKNKIISAAIESTTACTLGIILSYLYQDVNNLELFKNNIIKAINLGNRDAVEILLERNPGIDLTMKFEYEFKGHWPEQYSVLDFAIENVCRSEKEMRYDIRNIDRVKYYTCEIEKRIEVFKKNLRH